MNGFLRLLGNVLERDGCTRVAIGHAISNHNVDF